MAPAGFFVFPANCVIRRALGFNPMIFRISGTKIFDETSMSEGSAEPKRAIKKKKREYRTESN